MTAMTDERPIFENEEWLVTESGLEHKTTGYFIDRDSLGQRREDGLWAWPLHMAEKSWCTAAVFAEAFACAAATYRVEMDADLARTFRIARSEISPWPQPEKQRFHPAPPLPASLRPEESDTILWTSNSPPIPPTIQGPENSRDGWRPQKKARPFSAHAQQHLAHLMMVSSSASSRKPRQIRRTGTKLVRLLQAAWSTR
ncbi:hypothetical protein [Microvirga roseola]|uniref:hypothetical protein n=1 Tax=Microvirga roseola TaxID=2883126 RepID=UPI001E3C81F8|nr:hypothetical protein [Microvirga roseola]